MPRGGRRSGKQGQAYPNRTDLNKGKAVNAPYPTGVTSGTGSGVGWGEQQALMESQRAMPVGPPPGPTQQGAPPMPPGPAPGSLGQFDRPTERPHEPITHGLPIGPGGGPEVLSNPAGRPALHLLQQVANQPFVSDEIRQLLNIMQR